MSKVLFPSDLHRQTAERIHDFFAAQPAVDTVLILNSVARGKATPQSDLDMGVFLAEDISPAEASRLATAWQLFKTTDESVLALGKHGRFCHVHLDFLNGRYEPETWDDGGGPDAFELEIGNQLAYAVPMGTSGPVYQHLQTIWLPYYADSLRQQRLSMVRHACLYDLDHVPFFTERNLYFQAFDRLYKAFREYLQHLFIVHRRYPIAYNKWLEEQVSARLGRPDLYVELVDLLDVRMETAVLNQRAATLRTLVEQLPQE